MQLDWNLLSLALKDRSKLLPRANLQQYRQFLIEAFKKHAVNDLRLIFQHYFNEFEEKLTSLNPIYFRNQMRMMRKHPAVERVVSYILNDPEHFKCLKEALQSGGSLPCLKKTVDVYFEEQGVDWLLGQFELSDYEMAGVKRTQFMTKFVKLCQSGHQREIWRALCEFSKYVATNERDLIGGDQRNAELWRYKLWLHHNMN